MCQKAPKVRPLLEVEGTQMPLEVQTVHVVRASDRVRQKKGNSVAFSREIMRQERSIMRQMMRFF